MPVAFSLDHPRRVVLTRASDTITADDLIAHAEALGERYASGELDSAWVQVADYRAVTGAAEVSTDDIRRLAECNPFPPEALRVLIAPVSVVFGLGRMYESMLGGDGDHTQIVHTPEEAAEWMAARGREFVLTVN